MGALEISQNHCGLWNSMCHIKEELVNPLLPVACRAAGPAITCFCHVSKAIIVTFRTITGALTRKWWRRQATIWGEVGFLPWWLSNVNCQPWNVLNVYWIATGILDTVIRMFCEGVLLEINNPGKHYITLYSGVGNLFRRETMSSKLIVLYLVCRTITWSTLAGGWWQTRLSDIYL